MSGTSRLSLISDHRAYSGTFPLIQKPIGYLEAEEMIVQMGCLGISVDVLTRGGYIWYFGLRATGRSI